MPTTTPVLGQAAPAANTDTTLYTAPAGSNVVTSTLTICNRGTATAAFRVAVRPNGAALANAHYIFYDATVAPQATVSITIGMTLDAADVVTVRASTADLSFNLFGSVTT